MYSGSLSSRDRAGPIAAVILIHVGLAALLLTLNPDLVPPAMQQRLETFDVFELAPPPAPEPPAPQQRKPAPRPAAAAPPGRRSEATPVVAPPPRVVVPAPPPVVAAPIAGTGTEATQGAAASGSGTGAGGLGAGTGGGGTGAGGDGTGTHPRPLFRRLTARDLPRQLVDGVPRGARVFIMFTVLVDGRVTDCSIRESSGNPSVDAAVCQIAEQRFRYEPARRGDGTPYVAKAAYMQVF